jgi:hypothetical protein
MNMKNHILFAAMLALLATGPAERAWGSGRVNDPAKIASFIKVWGFLKYYHPTVTSGKIDWDSVFVANVMDADRIELDESIAKLLSAAGGPKSHGLRTSRETDSIVVRADVNWVDRLPVSASRKSELHAVFSDQVPLGTRYVSATAGTDNASFSAEDTTVTATYPEIGYRLLAIARYWNSVQYFYPNLDLIPDWSDTLIRYIPIVANATNAKEYQLGVLQLCCSIHDAHSVTYGPGITESLPMYYVPMPLTMIGADVVFRKPRVALDSFHVSFQPGDVLRTVNSQNVSEMLSSRSAMVAHSNPASLFRNAAPLLGFVETQDSVEIGFERKGMLMTARMKPLSLEQQRELRPLKSTGPAWKHLESGVGYVDLDQLEKMDVGRMFLDLKDTKSIIFDLRNYPKGVAWTIAPFLGTGLPWARFTKPNFSRPGSYVIDPNEAVVHPKARYAGKIIVLVNEQTQSQAEYTAMMFRTVPGCTIIGSQTAGADGDITRLRLPGNITTIFSGLGVYYLDGRPTQQVGIVPDVEVHPTIKGLAEGRDEVLEAALKIAKQ